MANLLLFDVNARAALGRGVDILADAVGCTLGPNGQNVVIEKDGGYPYVTKDGVTVAKAIILSDRYENLGAQIIKQAAASTCDGAGDGTTSSIVLAQAFFHAGKRAIAAGYDKRNCLKGMTMCIDDALEILDDSCKKVQTNEELRQVSTISANDDRQIGDLIAEAFTVVGTSGAIHVASAKGFRHYLRITEGFEIKRGFLSPYFITDPEHSRCELEDPYVVIYRNKLADVKQLLPQLEMAHQHSRGIFIIAHDIEGEALKALALNAARGSLKVCAIKAPEFGQPRVDAIEDLICLFSAENISPDDKHDLNDVYVGTCEKLVCNKTSTTFIGTPCTNEILEDRVATVRTLLEDPRLDDLQAKVINRRITRLTGKVANIFVGAATETELFETLDRVDDALQATRAAAEEGIVPGGGVALASAAHALRRKKIRGPDTAAGYHAARESLFATFRKIIENTGLAPEVAYEKLLKKNFTMGFNARTGSYEDLVSAGVIDPVKVVKASLINGFSAAKMLLTVGCAIIDDDIVQNEDNDVKIIEVLD